MLPVRLSHRAFIPTTFVFLCSMLTLAGCGSSSHGDRGSSSGEDPTSSVSTTVSASSGGTVTGPDGVQLTIPANALGSDTQITIQKSTASAAPLALGDGTVLPISTDAVYELLPHGVTFNTPVTVRIPVSGDMSAMTAYMSEPDSGWYPVATTAGSGYLEFTRNDFSSAAVASSDLMRWSLSRFEHVNIPGTGGTIYRAAYDVSNSTLNIPTGTEFSYAVDFTMDLASNTFKSSSCSSPHLITKSLDGVALNWTSPATLTQASSQINLRATVRGTFEESLSGTHTLILEVQCPAFATKAPQLRLKVNVIPKSQWRDDQYAIVLPMGSRVGVQTFLLGDDGGQLTGLMSTPLTLGSDIRDVAVSASGRMLYASAGNQIALLSVGDHGEIAYADAVAASGTAQSLAVVPAANALYALSDIIEHWDVFNPSSNSGHVSIDQYAVGSDDKLTALGGDNPIVTSLATDDVTYSAKYQLVNSPSGRYLYLNGTRNGFAMFRQYGIGANGALSNPSEAAFSWGSDYIAKIAPDDKRLFAVTWDLTFGIGATTSRTLRSIPLGDDGQLGTPAVHDSPNLKDLALDSTGRHLYTFLNSTPARIASLDIGLDGSLSELQSVTANRDSALFLEPSGHFLDVVEVVYPHIGISRYAIADNGTLTLVSTTELPGLNINSTRVAYIKLRGAPVTVGGTATLNGVAVTLQINGGSDLTLSNDGDFVFDTRLQGGNYVVTVLEQPDNGYTCSVTNGSGTLSGVDITNVGVTCSPPTYPVNVVVSGLTAGDSVTLLNNGGNALSVAMNGISNFSTQLVAGASYNVTVESASAGQACTVPQGSGTIDEAGVTVNVSCAAQSFTVGGNVSGLLSQNDSVTLQLTSGGNSASTVVTGDGSFTLDPPLLHGSSYTVSVLSQSDGNICSVGAGGSGTIAGENISSVQIACSEQLYSIGGTISDLGSSGLLLANGSDALTVASGATTFRMPTSLSMGSSYFITVAGQPSNDTCAVTSQGSGTVGTSDVTDISVACLPNQYTVGGSVSGLASSNDTMTLHVSSGSRAADLEMTGNGSFTFDLDLADGANFSVTVLNQPSGQTCNVSNGSGTINAADVSNVAVTCQSSGGSGPFTISGTVSGLFDTDSVVLQNNGGDDLTVTGDGGTMNFTFSTPIAGGGSYSITVLTQPQYSGNCLVTYGDSGTASADVTDVAITCM